VVLLFTNDIIFCVYIIGFCHGASELFVLAANLELSLFVFYPVRGLQSFSKDHSQYIVFEEKYIMYLHLLALYGVVFLCF